MQEAKPRLSGKRGAVAVTAIFTFMALQTLATETIDPQNNDRQYAWSENGGWLNAEPLGNDGPGMEVRNRLVAGWLWSENFGWISLNCSNTGSCGTVDFKVDAVPVDGQPGNYSFQGYAWAENIGWVSFSCENTGSCGSVNFGVSLSAQGEVSGFAWSENVGWVNFNCSYPGVEGDQPCGVVTTLFTDDLFKDGFEEPLQESW